MGSWLDRAREMAEPCANSANSANSPPIGTNGPNGTAAQTLSPDILDGLARLGSMSAPRGIPAAVWRAYVGDALWLAHEGVAAEAMAQGWSAIDLFGISADEQWQCLAAWIGGRRDDRGRACFLLREVTDPRRRLYAVHASRGRHSWHFAETAPPDARLPWSPVK